MTRPRKWGMVCLTSVVFFGGVISQGGVISFSKDKVCSRHGFDFEASYTLSPEGNSYNWREGDIAFLRRASEFNYRDYGPLPRIHSASGGFGHADAPYKAMDRMRVELIKARRAGAQAADEDDSDRSRIED
ncbi:hypothetical protein DL764_007226 [Monosporascus ibericus]|uniref:Uncharacterized protein n=1 Tax=Monosporascus ibericus TaxID=155417 RepID=A0A4Q4T2L9_9PEZI|nr:hypothetical protein DL764_007226 [Monosporascus ibericus]